MTSNFSDENKIKSPSILYGKVSNDVILQSQNINISKAQRNFIDGKSAGLYDRNTLAKLVSRDSRFENLGALGAKWYNKNQFTMDIGYAQKGTVSLLNELYDSGIRFQVSGALGSASSPHSGQETGSGHYSGTKLDLVPKNGETMASLYQKLKARPEFSEVRNEGNHIDVQISKAYYDKYKKEHLNISYEASVTGAGANITNKETSTDSGQRFLNGNITEQNYYITSENNSEYGTFLENQKFIESLGWATPALGAELKKAPDYSPINLQADEPSFLESLGLLDYQKQYAHLSTFGGFGLNLADNSRLNIFQTDIAHTSDAIGTSGSVLFNNSLGSVNSSDTYIAEMSQNATNSKDSTQDGILFGIGSAGFFFNPATAIIAVVGFIVSWLNKLFCGD